MSTLNLATLNSKDPYIEKIRAALETATGQQVPVGLVDVQKAKRVSGVSASPVLFNFAGGQKLTLYVRASADVFKAELNGKVIVLSGDFSNDWKQTFDSGVSGVAKLVRDSQQAIQTQTKKQKVVIPRASGQSTSVTAKLKAVQEQETQIDQRIVDKTAQRDLLQSRLEQAQAQINAVAA